MDYTTYLFANAPKDRKSTIFVDADRPTRSITWEGYASAVKRTAVGLKKIGITEGQCVGLWSRNDIYYYVLGDGVVAAGAVFTGLVSFMTRNELKKLQLTADVSWLFAEPELLDEALLAAKEVGMDTSHVLAFDPPGLPAYAGPQTAFSQLIENNKDTWNSYEGVQDARQKICFRLLTSGTTGVPKAAEMPHTAQIARIRSIVLFQTGHPSEVRFLQVVGMYHLTGLYISNAAVVGAHTAYITARSDPKRIVDNIQLHSITRTLLAPHTMEEIIQTIKGGYKSCDALGTLREVLIVGSTARQDSLVEFKFLLGKSAVVSSPYGSTETAAITFVPPNMPSIPGYVGVLAPDVEIQIINPDTLEPVPPNTEGELCIRSPALFSGYLNNPVATSASMLPDPTGRWYRTGDKGCFSTLHQQYTITGRYKEIFKVRYEEVSPYEVEAELMKHSGIRDAAVSSTIARDNEKDCECIAYVVVDLGLQASDVLEWLKGRLSRHKLPTGGVIFVEGIPRNGTGKVVRGELGKMEVQERSVRYLDFDGLENSERLGGASS